jgi:starch phosphorylase
MTMSRNEMFRKWGIFHKSYDAAGILNDFANHIEYSRSKDQYTATLKDLYFSMALTVRDRLVEQWIKTQQIYHQKDVKRVYYLSAEYLMGRALVNNLINLDIYGQTLEAMDKIDLDLEKIIDEEPDAGLGNGGLGRLAACFLDSMATVMIPAVGYGIRYEFGIFEQEIRNMGQHECPDEWLKYGNPWEIERPEYSFIVKFYGKVDEEWGPDGTTIRQWTGTKDIVGVAYDTPIAGYGNITVNTLRLWSAHATREFNLDFFQNGDYLKAVEQKNLSENISKVLYPNDSTFEGRELRLMQQYFFVSCSIQDIIRRYLIGHKTFDEFPDKAAIQLNDTHPSLAIPELMRLLIDEHAVKWDRAWEITQKTCAYTNHTLLPEALEEWPVTMVEKLLPRHLQIIRRIDTMFRKKVSLRYPGDTERLKRVSIVTGDPGAKIRMAHLAMVGSHSTNGVAALHTKLLKKFILKDLDEIFPGRINNKTNGITPRRWLLAANPGLASLITEKIGSDWVTDLEQLRRLEEFAGDEEFMERYDGVKKANKERLVKLAASLTDFTIDPSSIYDVQIKRFHEYKRQMLNILHVMYSWLRLKEDPDYKPCPRTYIFAGKAAPDYFISKLIISLVNHVAAMINDDSETGDSLKVIFMPNYGVTLAEAIIPAADVSEQISTAGYEASGTGNMKLALNGALTVGTLDGANIEIMEEVGEENIFIFGLNVTEARQLAAGYDAGKFLAADPILKKTVELLRNGFFSPQQKDLFRPLVDAILGNDRFLVLADFNSYRQAQERACREYVDRDLWIRKSILNVARSGKFSSDRTILEYNREIWHADRLVIPAEKMNATSADPAFIDRED